ncbi:MAG: polyketide cyclase [Cyanobacteria bacterium J06560_2]
MTFSYTLETTAAPETIWSIWTAVGWWPEWDSELLHAELEGDFCLGAVGRLKPRVGPVSEFSVSQIALGKSYTFTTKLLFCKLHVYRFLEPSNSINKTLFTHRVSFEGPLSFLFNLLLGPRFKRALPKAMAQIQQLAESEVRAY